MRDYFLTLLVAAAVTYLLTPLIRGLAGRVGALKQPRERDVHVVPIPTLGGLAMFGGLAAGLLAADQIPQLRNAFANTGMISGLLLAGGLLLVIGFIDDRWGMGALPKAAGQVAAGGILVATGTTLSWIPLPGGSTYLPTSNQATVLTILVVVATINAVNFIDGLDGLAAGLVGIAAISFFAYYYVLTKVVSPSLPALAAPALASAILIGMCLGFLPHNFSPAKIFMGDTGSMLLGLLLAYAPISGITSLPPAELTHQINRYPVVMPLILPAALLVIPYGDLLLAVVRRTRAGRSPFAPDRKHLHHRLLEIGHSQRASVLIMYLWAAVFSGIIVWLSIEKTETPNGANHHGQPIWVFVLVTVLAVVVLLLMSMPRLRWWQRPRLAGAPAGPVGSALPDSAALADPGTLADPAGTTGQAGLPADAGTPIAVAAPAVSGPVRHADGQATLRPVSTGSADTGPGGPGAARTDGVTGSRLDASGLTAGTSPDRRSGGPSADSHDSLIAGPGRSGSDPPGSSGSDPPGSSGSDPPGSSASSLPGSSGASHAHQSGAGAPGTAQHNGARPGARSAPGDISRSGSGWGRATGAGPGGTLAPAAANGASAGSGSGRGRPNGARSAQPSAAAAATAGHAEPCGSWDAFSPPPGRRLRRVQQPPDVSEAAAPPAVSEAAAPPAVSEAAAPPAVSEARRPADGAGPANAGGRLAGLGAPVPQRSVVGIVPPVVGPTPGRRPGAGHDREGFVAARQADPSPSAPQRRIARMD